MNRKPFPVRCRIRNPGSVVLLAICVAVLSGVFSDATRAEVYKCRNREGKTVYQSHPCELSGTAVQLDAGREHPLAGCFDVILPGWESGSQTARFEIRSLSSDRFEIFGNRRGTRQKMFTMKRANSKELAMLSEAFGVKFMFGLNNDWAGDHPDYKPVGLYRIKHPDGRETLFLYLFMANGKATKVECK